MVGFVVCVEEKNKKDPKKACIFQSVSVQLGRRLQQCFVEDHDLKSQGASIRDAAYEAANAQNQAALKPLTADEQYQFLDLMTRIIGTSKAT